MPLTVNSAVLMDVVIKKDRAKTKQILDSLRMVLQTQKSYGLIILYPEVPVIAKTVVSKIKPIVRAVKNLLRSDTPKLANIGLPK